MSILKSQYHGIGIIFFVCVCLWPNVEEKKSVSQSNFNWILYDFHFFQRDLSYNAYEKDIAIVNIFFGDSTVFGRYFIANVFTKSISIQNLRDRRRWLGWTSSLALAASADFALASALFPFLKFSTGSPLSFAEISSSFEDWKRWRTFCPIALQISKTFMC